MTKIITAVLLLAFVSVQAQSNKYENAMIGNIQVVDTTASVALLNKAAAIFSALYEADPKWEARYYQAFALIRTVKYEPSQEKKEAALKKAEELLAGLP